MASKSTTTSPSAILLAILLGSMVSVSLSSVSGYEFCIRRALSPLPPVPVKPRAAFLARIQEDRCKIMRRGVDIELRSTGKLPDPYVKALCDVLGNGVEVERYVAAKFPTYDFDSIMDGKSCGVVAPTSYPN